MLNPQYKRRMRKSLEKTANNRAEISLAKRTQNKSAIAQDIKNIGNQSK
jgi:hypothetical protein